MKSILSSVFFCLIMFSWWKHLNTLAIAGENNEVQQRIIFMIIMIIGFGFITWMLVRNIVYLSKQRFVLTVRVLTLLFFLVSAGWFSFLFFRAEALSDWEFVKVLFVLLLVRIISLWYFFDREYRKGVGKKRKAIMFVTRLSAFLYAGWFGYILSFGEEMSEMQAIGLTLSVIFVLILVMGAAGTYVLNNFFLKKGGGMMVNKKTDEKPYIAVSKK